MGLKTPCDEQFHPTPHDEECLFSPSWCLLKSINYDATRASFDKFEIRCTNASQKDTCHAALAKIWSPLSLMPIHERIAEVLFNKMGNLMKTGG